MTTIGFIGTGEIASAMVEGLAGRGHKILISPRNAERATSLAARFDEVEIASNNIIVEASDVVFLCLMAGVARTELPKLSFRVDQEVISAMVDMPLDELCELCAPATEISICIPLPSIANGASAVPVYPNSNALRGLYGDRNLILPCRDERALNAHFAASALASPILDQMCAGANWLAAITGDQDAAAIYVASFFEAFLNDIKSGADTDFETLLGALSTEGGLNATLRAHMREKGTIRDLHDGLDDLKPRLGLNG